MEPKSNIKLIAGVVIVLVVIIGGYFVFLKNQSSTETGPIKIGFIGPLTGDAASYGIDEKNSTMLAVNEINENGGIKGRKIEIIYEDGKCTGKDAVIAAQKLINIDKTKIILGGACSGETMAIAPITEQNKVILFSAFSSNPDITNAGDYLFRNAPSDLDVAKSYVDFIVKNENHKNIALISGNTDYTSGVRKVLKDRANELEANIVSDEVFNQGSKDFKTNIAKIKSSNVDAIFINPQDGVAGGLILKQIRDLGIKTQVYSTFVFSGKDALSAAGSAINGLIYFDLIGLNGEVGQKFIDKFVTQFGKIGGSEYNTGSRYDSVYIIADALKKCSENADCIKDYLYGMDWYNGTVGKYKFDRNGDVVGIEPLTPKIVVNGKAELRYRS